MKEEKTLSMALEKSTPPAIHHLGRGKCIYKEESTILK